MRSRGLGLGNFFEREFFNTHILGRGLGPANLGAEGVKIGDLGLGNLGA